MVANNTLRISELDYNEIRENLKDFLRGRPEFTDIDFEGSGISVLIDLLAYNTHYMGYHLNMVGNEMFHDTAQLRSSLISHAKLMNYVPTSRKGADAFVNISVTPGNSEDNEVSLITLPRGTNFLSDPIDGVSYNFVTVNSNTAVKTNGTFSFSNVVITQGEYIAMNYVVDSSNPLRQYIIPSANIDTSTLMVSVQESVANTYTETYTLADDITEITGTSKVYFVEESSYANNSYLLYFGDNVIGKKPSDGNIIRISYLDTQGFVANRANGFTIIDDIDGFSANVSIRTAQRSSGGSEKESIEQIRFRAPYFYTAQNRMVTKNDYRSLLTKDYPNIQSVAIWGGEENDSPVYGKVFISLNPVDNYVISLDEKERIKEDIVRNRSVMTVTPEIIDPDKTYMLTNVITEYDNYLTTRTPNDLRELIIAAIFDYRDSYLNKFNTTFRLSRLINILNNLEPSILSSEIYLHLQKRVEVTLNEFKTYTLNFDIPLYKSGSLYSYPAIKVYDANSIERSVFIEEIPNSFTGIDSISVDVQGTGYTSTPTVEILGDGQGATATAKIVNGKLESVTLNNAGSGYTAATVNIIGGGGTGAQASPILESNNGVLRTFYYKDNGEKVIVNATAGTIKYKEGIVVLNNLKVNSVVGDDFYGDETFTINIKPSENTITPKRNQILTIDVNDPNATRVTIRRNQDN